MSGFGLPTEIVIGVLAALTTIVVVLVLQRVVLSALRSSPTTATNDHDVTAFLFDGPVLLDATPNARQLLDVIPTRDPDRTDVGALLESRFPGIQQQMAMTNDATETIAAAAPSAAMAELKAMGDSLRLTIQDAPAADTGMHPLALAAMKDELAALRHIGEDAPQLIWKLDTAGTVVWANKAYLKVADKVRIPSPGLVSDWPPVALFSDIDLQSLKDTPDTQRRHLSDQNADSPLWFDVTSSTCDRGSIHFASDAGAIVAAEQQGKLFVQTLTKTFADLSTGLAIFDRSRRLVMFNPSLMELTRLPVTFLSGRPVFSSVLDRLRDAGMLPEPKNYTTWRDQVAALETEAQQGTYCENWALPGGETYRVTGRPHPNGALAFLVEDISAEISLTRTFRSELETAHAVLDSIDEAIVVFSPAGTMMMSNSTYDSVWAYAPFDIAGSTFQAEIDHWQSICVPTPIWDKMRGYGTGQRDRDTYVEHIHAADGRLFACRVAPLTGGATLIGFRHVRASPIKDSLEANRLQDAGSILESQTG